MPTTELLTIQDVRTGRNKNGVHFFTTKDFNKDVVANEWERIKVVCSQPYDAHIRYGLACFVVKSIKEEDNNSEEDFVQKEAEKREEKKIDDVPGKL